MLDILKGFFETEQIGSQAEGIRDVDDFRISEVERSVSSLEARYPAVFQAPIIEASPESVKPSATTDLQDQAPTATYENLNAEEILKDIEQIRLNANEGVTDAQDPRWN